MKGFHLEIVTPAGRIFEGEAEFISCPGIYGGFGILRNHEPYCTALSKGTVSVKPADNGHTEKHYTISGGIFHFAANRAVLLADDAAAADVGE